MRNVTQALIASMVVSLIVGCGGNGATLAVSQVRPGVYTTGEASGLPLPASGYDLFSIGEAQHGVRQTKLVFFTYLELLHGSLGLRDVVLEEDQVYEEDANAYVLGISDALRVDLCLRADVLAGIRALNQRLAQDEKIRVHLVDVDSPLPAIHAHLLACGEALGPAAKHIPIPSLIEFESWNQDDTLSLVNQLADAAGDRDAVVNALETVQSSLHFYFAGNRIGIGPPVGYRKYAPIREAAITRNINHLLQELSGAPILVFFGSSHTQKRQGALIGIPELRDFKPWAQRLSESGVSVYSLTIGGLSGTKYWRGQAGETDWGAGKIQLPDGTTLDAALDAAPDHHILYVDLRVDTNASARLGKYFKDIPAGDIYDGLVLFREFTPMEDECP